MRVQFVRGEFLFEWTLVGVKFLLRGDFIEETFCLRTLFKGCFVREHIIDGTFRLWKNDQGDFLQGNVCRENVL